MTNGFIDNLGAFLRVTGNDAGHIAWWLAGVPWPDEAARDDFIATIASPVRPS